MVYGQLPVPLQSEYRPALIFDIHLPIFVGENITVFISLQTSKEKSLCYIFLEQTGIAIFLIPWEHCIQSSVVDSGIDSL